MMILWLLTAFGPLVAVQSCLIDLDFPEETEKPFDDPIFDSSLYEEGESEVRPVKLFANEKLNFKTQSCENSKHREV